MRDTTIIEEKGGVAPVKMHSSQNAVCQDVWSTPVLTGFLALTEVGCQPGSRGCAQHFGVFEALGQRLDGGQTEA